jgi:hypothetical protein
VKSFFNTTINWLFRKSWITLLLGLTIPFAFIKTSNGWILFFSLLYYFPAAIIHYKGKRWVGYIASLLSLMVTVLLTFVVGFAMTYFPDPSDVHEDYASVYENREKIESITGISIPDFTVDSSKITYMSQFDFEFTSEAVLRFKTLPDEKTFRYLDSLCELYTEPTVDTTVTGPPQPEPVNTFWSKEKDAYHFSLYGNTEDKKLHSEDAFFSMTINRNSRIAKVRYGNY